MSENEDLSTRNLMSGLLTEQMIEEADAEEGSWAGNPERHAQLKNSLIEGLEERERKQDTEEE